MPYNGQIEARKNRSAIDAAVILVPKAQEVWKNRQIAGELLIDVKDAFNHVFRAELAQRMIILGIDDHLIWETKSFLSDR